MVEIFFLVIIYCKMTSCQKRLDPKLCSFDAIDERMDVDFADLHDTMLSFPILLLV